MLVATELNESVILPLRGMAQSVKKDITGVLYLNSNDQGHIEVVGQPQPLGDFGQIKDFLRREYRNREVVAGPGKVNTTVIIRGDRNSQYGLIFQILRQCKEQGFRKMQLRARSKT